ncbi:hypothetical protein [Pseudomonas monteilii]|uniref:hypothetical protein n=1 Tax=Pseudomonas monteilii TaxID=76759 RepID=UPI00383B3E4B
MTMSRQHSPSATGTITVYEKVDNEGGGDSRALIVEGAGSDKRQVLEMGGFSARKIHMINIPSATTIELQSKAMEGDAPKWWIKLKTTHAPSDLDQHDIDQYVNRNGKGSFIPTALGILVVDKSKNQATRDSLGRIIVQTSAGRRPTTE